MQKFQAIMISTTYKASERTLCGDAYIIILFLLHTQHAQPAPFRSFGVIFMYQWYFVHFLFSFFLCLDSFGIYLQ